MPHLARRHVGLFIRIIRGAVGSVIKPLAKPVRAPPPLKTAPYIRKLYHHTCEKICLAGYYILAAIAAVSMMPSPRSALRITVKQGAVGWRKLLLINQVSARLPKFTPEPPPPPIVRPNNLIAEGIITIPVPEKRLKAEAALDLLRMK